MKVLNRLRQEDGFTLVELSVVLVNVGIILALATPAFLGAVQRTQDQSAKASVRTALTAGRIVYASEADYASATVTELQDVDGSILWVDEITTSVEPKTVSRDTAGGLLTLAAYSKAGNCFFLIDDPEGAPQFGSLASVPATDCFASNTAAVTFGPSW